MPSLSPRLLVSVPHRVGSSSLFLGLGGAFPLPCPLSVSLFLLSLEFLGAFPPCSPYLFFFLALLFSPHCRCGCSPLRQGWSLSLFSRLLFSSSSFSTLVFCLPSCCPTLMSKDLSRFRGSRLYYYDLRYAFIDYLVGSQLGYLLFLLRERGWYQVQSPT